MSEPVNPLFEEEKEFLERKKLEYERALQGDVEHIKDQTVQVGKIALVGAGLAGGIWLLSKAFGRRKRKEWHYAQSDGAYEDDLGGFGDDDYAEHDQPTSRRGWNDYPTEDDYFSTTASFADAGTNSDDDNGLSEFPEFEAHSATSHGGDSYDAQTGVYHAQGPETDDNEAGESRPFWSSEHSHPSANLPYDDSRRMPTSSSFAEADAPAEAAEPRGKGWVGPALMSFLQSETGRVLAAQAAAVALALVTKAVQNLLPSDEAEPAKSSDLAASTAAGVHPYGQPAAKPAPQSPVSDAKDPDTDSSNYHSLA